MNYFRFLGENIRWLLAGGLLLFTSTFGQTYFIALFGAHIRRDFALSHGDFGLLYMVATLASAAVLVQLGTLADKMGLKPLGLMAIGGLGLACVLMSFSSSWWALLLTLFLLRLWGQGMLSHIATTAVARWFNHYRGRALGFVALGHSAGEALFPGLAVFAMLFVNWRQTWLLAFGVLLLVIVPLFLILVRQERVASDQSIASDEEEMIYHWSRKNVIGDKLFYALLPGLMAPSFVVTVLFFHQSHLIALNGWSLAAWTAFFPLFAISSIVFSLFGGWAIDRWSARKMLPVYLLPLVAAMMVFTFGQSLFSALVGMILIGFNVGLSQTVSNALWAELYGTKYLGSIKAMTNAAAVFATAIGPGFTGLLLDTGVSLKTILFALGLVCLVACLVFYVLQEKLFLQRSPTI